MKVVVFGGTGRIGKQVVALLHAQGVDAMPVSPESGVDALSGRGVAEAVAGASVTVDVMNAMIFDTDAAVDFFGRTSRNLATSARAAGVQRHVVLSIVGTDRLGDSGYMAGKLAQERAVQESGIRHTIVRATQFIEFLPTIADGFETDGRIEVPHAFVQPVAAPEVAQAIVDVIFEPDAPDRVEVAGPDRLTMAEAIRLSLTAGDPRPVMESATAQYFGAVLTSDELVPLGDARLGRIHIAPAEGATPAR